MKLYNVHRNTVSNNSAKPRVLLATPPKPSFALNPAGDFALDSSSGLEGTATSLSSCTCCRSCESDPSSDKVDIAGAISYLQCEISPRMRATVRVSARVAISEDVGDVSASDHSDFESISMVVLRCGREIILIWSRMSDGY